MIEQIALSLAGAVAGLCAGSFVTTAALRSTRAEQVIFGRSHCDDCGRVLTFADTAPVISYLRLGGACAACGGRIDPLHTAGEIAGSVMVGGAFALVPAAAAGAISALGLALLASAIIDRKTKTLPDALTAAVAMLGAGLAWLHSLEALWIGTAAAALTFLSLEAVRHLFLRIRGKPGLGFGDVKLISALALWLGLATPMMIAVAAGLGLLAFVLTKPSDERMPFGPMIALAGWSIGFVQEAAQWPRLG